MSHNIEVELSRQPKRTKTTASSSDDENSPNFKSDVDKANWFSLLNFSFIFSLIFRAFKLDKKGKDLTDKDLITFPYHLRADELEKKYMERLKNQEKKSPKKKINTAVAVFMTIKWMFFKAVFIQVLFCFLRIFSGWIIKELIDCFLDTEKAKTDAFWWAGIQGGLLILGMYSEHHWIAIITSLSSHVRAGIISMIYNKITRLSMYTITKLSPGQFVNLAANDVNTIEMMGFYFPSVISGWLCLIAGAALLWIYFGPTCLIGILYMAVNIPIQAVCANATKKPKTKKNDVTDERVRRTAELIQDIRLLKMYTWEMKFKDMITTIRNKDVALMKQVFVWECLSRALA